MFEDDSYRALISGQGWGEFAAVVIRMEGATENIAEGEANLRLILQAPELFAFAAEFAAKNPIYAKGHDKERIAQALALVAKVKGTE